ncbi:MFS transporter [Dactylosporangium sp. NPDC000244]|uniref:MFS transporter n=1 Tax=Dactylosporangium sp. NPDC000244 TaxID=3154365 RepID=UPI00332AB80A
MPADVRRLSRRGVGWALLSDAVPLYPLYALLFTDTGLSGGEISLLFALWSAVGIAAEVPTGALADRFSRRANLVAAGLLQAAGFALWTALPSFAVFAAGFVLWGLGGALASGSIEALLYDGLLAAGHESRYVRVSGQVTAAGLVAQVPAAVVAAVLFPLGGYPLVGWVSVAICLAASALAARLPEVRGAAGGPVAGDGDGPGAGDGDGPGAGDGGGPGNGGGLGYFATLRDGVREAAGRPAVRAAALVLAALAGLDAVEEYFPLLAHGWGVPTALNPAATLVITLGGAAGAALAARAGGLPGRGLAGLMLAAGLLLAGAAALDRPAGIVLVAGFYGLYRLVLVIADARLQAVIDGAARATVTSVAALATELSALLLFGAWAVGGVWCVAVLTAALSITMVRREQRE